MTHCVVGTTGIALTTLFPTGIVTVLPVVPNFPIDIPFLLLLCSERQFDYLLQFRCVLGLLNYYL